MHSFCHSRLLIGLVILLVCIWFTPTSTDALIHRNRLQRLDTNIKHQHSIATQPTLPPQPIGGMGVPALIRDDGNYALVNIGGIQYKVWYRNGVEVRRDRLGL